MPDATLKQVIDYFGISMTQFAKEWKQLSEEERQQIKAGIGDKSFTY